MVHPALLQVPDTADLPCEIRNFCQAGVLLKLAEPGAEKNLPRERRSQAALLLPAGAQAETAYRLEGRLSHVSPNGVGFVFALPPPFPVLLALQEKALPGPPPGQALPAEQAQIHANCLQALDKALRLVADALPAQIQLALAESDGLADAAGWEERARPVAEQFYAHVLAQAKSFVVPDLSLQPEAGAIYSDSQADRVLFEDWMSLIDKVIQLESKYEDALKLLEPRLGLLARREVLNVDNPFGPNVLCHSFHYALKTLELDNSQRNQVYGAFSRLLDERLPGLYGDVQILSKDLDALKPGGEKPEEPAHSRILTAAPVSSAFKAPFQAGPPDKPFAAAAPAAEPWKPQAAGAVYALPAPAGKMQAPPQPPDAFSAFVLLFRYAEGQANKNLAQATGEADRAAGGVDQHVGNQRGAPRYKRLMEFIASGVDQHAGQCETGLRPPPLVVERRIGPPDRQPQQAREDRIFC